MSALPNGWQPAEANQICRLIRGVSYEKSAARSEPAEGYVGILRATNIQGNQLNKSDLVYVPAEFVSADQYLQPGDILIATSSGSKDVVGKTAVATSAFTDCAFGAFCSVARPLDPDRGSWLNHFTKSKAYRDYVESVALGININNFRTSDLAALPLLIAPEEEQRLIIKKLDNLCDRSARAHRELDRIPKLIERYKQTILAKGFSGELTKKSYKEVTTVSAYIKGLDQGWSPKCEAFSRRLPTQWAVLKTTAVQPIHFDERANKALPSHLEPRPAIEVCAGDVLITRAGPRSRVGITCVVKSTGARLMLADKLYRLKVETKFADPVWLALMLNSPQALAQIEEMKTGISDSGLNLTQAKFVNLSLPKVSLKNQAEVVRLVEHAFFWLDKIVTEHARADHLLPKLDQAILAKAFRGELVSKR